MKLKRARGIILRIHKTGETTKLLVVYTKEKGKLTLVAKGARKPLSKYAGSIDLGNYVEFVYYWKENRDVFYISDATLLDNYEPLKYELSKFWIFNCLLELVNVTTPAEEPNYKLFGVLMAGLDTLSKWNLSQARILLYGFIMKLLKAQGLSPELENCIDCGKPLKNIRAYLNASKGGFVCPRCIKLDNEAKIIAGADIRKLLLNLTRVSFENIKNIKLTVEQDVLLRKIVHLLLTHYSSGKILKCKELL